MGPLPRAWMSGRPRVVNRVSRLHVLATIERALLYGCSLCLRGRGHGEMTDDSRRCAGSRRAAASAGTPTRPSRVVIG